MTSSYLLQPKRSEHQARIDRAARAVMKRYPATTWFAKNEKSEKDIRALAFSVHSELTRESDEAQGKMWCPDCLGCHPWTEGCKPYTAEDKLRDIGIAHQWRYR